MILIVLCGAPGSGKTTLSMELVKKYGAIRYSLDEMKYFRHRYLIPHIKDSLKLGNNVIVDATYHMKEFRVELINGVKDIDCKKILIYMNTPLEECINRNSQRIQPLPKAMVEGIFRQIQTPTSDEGWDEILYY